MRVKLLLFIGFILIFSGCNNVQTAEGENGLRQMNNNERDNTEEWFFTTNQSSTSYIDATESRPHIGTDQDKIRDVVDTFDNVTPGSVFINGHDAYVTVHATQSYTVKQRDQLRHKLLTDITKAMPRYHIHVRVHDGDGDR
jgi:hypothetical protein